MQYQQLSFSFLLLLLTSVSASQPKMQAAVSDRFTLNISNTLQTVVAVATDAAKPVKYAALDVPGNRKADLTRRGIRYENMERVEHWLWMSGIRGQNPPASKSETEQLYLRLNNIVDSLYPGRKKEGDYYASFLVNGADIETQYAWNDQKAEGTVYLSVAFKRRGGPSEEAVVQALKKEYLQAIAAAPTPMVATGLAKRYGDAMFEEGLSKEKATQVYAELVKETANTNIILAYDFLMSASSQIDVSQIKDMLPEEQKRQITGMAKKVLDDYYSSFNTQKTLTPSTNTTNTKSIGAKDPCPTGSEAGAGSFKIGKFLNDDYGGVTAVIKSYDCKTKIYKIITRHYSPPPKSYFWSGQDQGYFYFTEDSYTFEQLSKMYAPSVYEYESCSVCKGSGVELKEVVHSRGGEWEQINFNVHLYTPGRVISSYEKRVRCDKCLGMGWRQKQK